MKSIRTRGSQVLIALCARKYLVAAAMSGHTSRRSYAVRTSLERRCGSSSSVGEGLTTIMGSTSTSDVQLYSGAIAWRFVLSGCVKHLLPGKKKTDPHRYPAQRVANPDEPLRTETRIVRKEAARSKRVLLAGD